MPTERAAVLPALLRKLRGDPASQRSSHDGCPWNASLDGLEIVLFTATPPHFTLESVSPSAAAVFGLPLDQWTNNPEFWCEWVHPDHFVGVMARLEDALSDPAGGTAEFRTRDAQGGIRHVRMAVITDPPDGTGRPMPVRGALLDLTALRTAEHEARTADARTRALLDQASIALLVHDREGRVLDANDAACAMIGCTHAAMLGLRMSDILVTNTEEEAKRLWQHLPEDEILRREAEYRRRDGATFPVDLRLRYGPWEGRDAIITTARDLSERKRLEHQLRHSQKMEAVGRLAGGVAHDFNNLLTAIKGHADLLLQDAQTEEVRRDLREITNAADRAAALTRKLLAFSRQQIFAPEILDLNRIVADTSRLLRPLIGEHIAFRTEAGPIGKVRADHGQIEQVVVNLVVNAKDAMPSGGQLTLATSNLDVDDGNPFRYDFVRPGRYVVLRVSDTGHGMDPHTLARVFEPFFTTKEKGKGSGLGLAIAYGIVKQSGGYLIAESEQGRGATFLVILPRSDAAENAVVATDITSLPTGNGLGKVVLVIEDETPVRSLVCRVLGREGFRVLEAGTGEEALRRAAEVEYAVDLVLADVVLPDMDGREVARRLAEQRPELRVVLMSGYSELPANTAETEARARLHKPFTPAELASRVHEALAG